MDFVKDWWGIIVAFLTAAIWIGANQQKVEELAADQRRHDKDLDELKIEYKKDMENIRAFFSSPDGGTKFLTYPVHQDICDRNTKLLAQEVQHLTEAVVNNTKEVGEMKSQVGRMTVAIAILEEADRPRGNHG